MNLLILPGNSIKNKSWAMQCAQTLNKYFEQVSVHEYEHWASGKDIIDFDLELKSLAQYDKDKKWCVISKSAGIILTMKAFESSILKPLKSVFLGVPVAWSKELGIDFSDQLKIYSVPTFFIQNASDPACSFVELRQILDETGFKPSELFESDGNGHQYDDFHLISNVARRFFLEDK